jgi:hypothetical protein
MDGTEIDDQIKKAELYETVKQTLMRLLDDPQVQQKMLEILLQRLGRTLTDLKQLSGQEPETQLPVDQPGQDAAGCDHCDRVDDGDQDGHAEAADRCGRRRPGWSRKVT